MLPPFLRYRQMTSETVVQAIVTPPIEPTVRVFWHDTPDYYATGTLPRFFDEAHADAIVSAGSGYGGGGALSGSTASAYVVVYPRDLEDGASFGFGCRIRITAWPASEKVLVAAIDEDGSMQMCVSVATDGTLGIWRGNMATELARTATPIPTYTELKFGFRGTISRTAGLGELFLDGESVLRIDAVNTAAVDPQSWQGIYLGLWQYVFLSHLYIGDGAGVLLPGYLVQVNFPSAIADSDWTANTGTVDDALDDADADDDTTYAYSQAVGDAFALEFDTLATTRAIYGTRAVALVKNAPDSGSPSFRPNVRGADGTAIDVGDWRSCNQEEWTAVDRFDRRNPFTDDQWTVADVNATGWGGQTES
jgi:hypothetical protein